MTTTALTHFDSTMAGGFCWVYVFVRDDTREAKIGVSTTPFCRLDQIQSYHAAELRFAVAYVGSEKIEQRMHRRFAAFRIRGEWFRLSPEIEKWITATQRLMRCVHRDFYNDAPHRQAEQRVMAFLDRVNGRSRDSGTVARATIQVGEGA